MLLSALILMLSSEVFADHPRTNEDGKPYLWAELLPTQGVSRILGYSICKYDPDDPDNPDGDEYFPPAWDQATQDWETMLGYTAMEPTFERSFLDLPPFGAGCDIFADVRIQEGSGCELLGGIACWMAFPTRDRGDYIQIQKAQIYIGPLWWSLLPNDSWRKLAVTHEWGHNLSLDDHYVGNCEVVPVTGGIDAFLVMSQIDDETNPCREVPTFDDVYGVVCNGYGFECRDVGTSWIITLGPPPVAISNSVGRFMWLIAEAANYYPTYENVESRLQVYPSVTGCAINEQLVLPGRESMVVGPKERRIILYRVRFECHSPAPPSVVDMYSNLCTRQNPWNGDLRSNNDCRTEGDSLITQ